MNKTKRFFFGNTWYLPPFRLMGYWVEDAMGKNVAEASDLLVGKALVDMLNAASKNS